MTEEEKVDAEYCFAFPLLFNKKFRDWLGLEKVEEAERLLSRAMNRKLRLEDFDAT